MILHLSDKGICLSYTVIYLVDIEDNKVWEFDSDGLELLLKEDPQLWNEFKNLKKHKKKQMKYNFLIRYNAKNPLYISTD